jgi:hypothetical protein
MKYLIKIISITLRNDKCYEFLSLDIMPRRDVKGEC